MENHGLVPAPCSSRSPLIVAGGVVFFPQRDGKDLWTQLCVTLHCLAKEVAQRPGAEKLGFWIQLILTGCGPLGHNEIEEGLCPDTIPTTWHAFIHLSYQPAEKLVQRR